MFVSRLIYDDAPVISSISFVYIDQFPAPLEDTVFGSPIFTTLMVSNYTVCRLDIGIDPAHSSPHLFSAPLNVANIGIFVVFEWHLGP